MKPPVIVPTFLLRQCLEEGLLTNTHVCYASLVASSRDYASFYRERSKEGDTIILDHCPSLPRMSVDSGLFIRVIDYIKPKAIVLPDRDFDQRRTIRMVETFLERVKYCPDLRDIPTIGVLQGTSVKELEDCYLWMKERVVAIGLHSGLENILSRNSLVGELGIGYPAVLIEVHKDLMEETPRGSVIDLGWSSMPIRLAYQGRKLNSIYPTPPLLNFEDQYSPPLLKQNLEGYVDRFSVRTREMRRGDVRGKVQV